MSTQKKGEGQCSLVVKGRVKLKSKPWQRFMNPLFPLLRLETDPEMLSFHKCRWPGHDIHLLVSRPHVKARRLRRSVAQTLNRITNEEYSSTYILKSMVGKLDMRGHVPHPTFSHCTCVHSFHVEFHHWLDGLDPREGWKLTKYPIWGMDPGPRFRLNQAHGQCAHPWAL